VRRLEREKSERENDRRRRLVRVDVDLVAMSNSSEAISYRDQWIDPNGPVRWPRSFEQNFRVVKWIFGRG